jgi:peptidyl-prolyl cis-trans isomerase SurA
MHRHATSAHGSTGFRFRGFAARRSLLRWSAAALLAAAAVVARPSAEVIEQVLVKVNGDILTKTDLEQRQINALRGRNIPANDDEALKQAIAEVTPTILAETIDEMLLVQRGRELGYKMTDEDFDRVVNNIRKENKLESEEAFHAALAQEGITLAELRNSLERQMLIARVQQAEVTGKIGITEEEARKYHSEHLDQFTRPGEVTIREILIGVEGGDKGINVGQDEDAKAKAEAARKRIVDGESFEQVAADVSTSPSRANGGLVGPLNPAELNAAFQELLGSLKPGDVSEVRRVQNGYQIIKLESRTPDQVLTAEQARDRIADAIFDQKRRVELRKYLVRLRADAIIEWKNEEIRKAWESGVNATAQPAPPEAAGPTS